MGESKERVLEITQPANIHIYDRQVQIEQDDSKVVIMIKD